MPSASAPPSAASQSALIGGRYALQHRLGQGGMAVVYEVRDVLSGQARALKRLDTSGDPKKQRRAAQLFEREFHQLTQLAHPRVVQVYEYAIDETGPYYTMELLDGGDLHALAPLDWRRACAIARDICSALSLLHSRQLIHRDLSPRNVRCGEDGHAKLIDFGAMANFGPNNLVVGTPACCAPEIVAMQALDARTDLYALGATLYFMLTGRYAYPARQFSHLAELWREPIARPSHNIADLPEALESLVLSLLRLDPDARPASASEVTQRLSAIDGCKLDESLLVAQAYLSTPTLVGRAKPLARTRARLRRTLHGESSVIAIEGPSGVGRSRFLDACVLEGTLLGLTVVRIGADQAQAGDWGLVRSIGAELLRTIPDAALEAARPTLDILGHALPDYAARAPEVELQEQDPERMRPQLQAALRQWLLRLCTNKPLLLAVDDLQRVDEPSATMLALLACELGQEPLVLLASLEPDSTPVSVAACKLLREHCIRMYLHALDVQDSENLLRSLFGEVPNVDVLAHRLWTLSSGNPRQIMRLAQHMLDQDLVRYHGGTWTLPSAVDAANLPLSASQAQRARVAALSPRGRELANALALCPDLDFSREEVEVLSGDAAANGGVFDDLFEELLRGEVVRNVREHIALAHPTWGGFLVAELTAEMRARTHVRLAEALSMRTDQSFRVAQHYLLAGEIDRGLDLLVEHARRSQEETARSERVFAQYVHSLPPDWLQVVHRGVELCVERGRGPNQRYELLSRLAGILAMLALDDKPHMAELMRLLEQYSGLSDYAALEPGLEGMPRLVKALEQTQARYDQTPVGERVLAPIDAIKQLARGVIAASGVAAMSMDAATVRRLPSLAPLVPLSPALGLVELLTGGMSARYAGRFERALEYYEQILERTAQPDRGGLDAAHSGYMRMGVMNGVGMIEAGLGRPRCLEYAGQLEGEPTHRVNALQIRMLYQLWQGNGVEADRHKHSVDRVRIENSSRHWFEGSHLLWEINAYGICDDVIHIKHAREELAQLAVRYDTWRAVDQYAAALYYSSCGDNVGALRAIQQALSLTAAGEHQTWVHIAATHLRVLRGLSRSAEALTLGEQYLAQAEVAQLGYHVEYVRLALAAVQAKLGRYAEAVSGAEQVIARFTGMGVTGLNLGWAYETRARVAMEMRDAEGFKHFADLTGQIYRAHKHPPLAAKLDKLLREGKRHLHGEQAVDPRHSIDSSATARITTVLAAGRTPEARAAIALTLLLEHSHAPHGFLFAVDSKGAQCIARSGAEEPDEALLERVRDYVSEAADEAADITRDETNVDEEATVSRPWLSENGRRYRPVMLSHYVGSELVISGVAVLDVSDEGTFVYPAQVATDLSKYGSNPGLTAQGTQQG